MSILIVAAFWREQEHEQWSLLDAIGDKFALKRLHSFWRLQDSNDPSNLKLSCSSLARVTLSLTNFESLRTPRVRDVTKTTPIESTFQNLFLSPLTIFVFFSFFLLFAERSDVI